MIKISIIHPSKGRPQKAVAAMRLWLAAAVNPEKIEYLLGLDGADPSLPDYISEIPADLPVRIIIKPDNRTIIEAGNLLAKEIAETSELIVGVSDDIDPCPRWDEKLMELLAGVDNFHDPKVIRCNDGIHKWERSMILHLNHAWVNRFGWLVCPEYTGCFCDDDIVEVAKRINALIDAPQLVFMHRHYSVGLAEYDATYDSHNNDKDYFANKKIFEARKKRNFDL
jgi:hypothetical protein